MIHTSRRIRVACRVGVGGGTAVELYYPKGWCRTWHFGCPSIPYPRETTTVGITCKPADKKVYVLCEILVQGRCYGREDLQASSQHIKKKHGQSSDLHRLQGHQASESEVSMSNAVNLLRPDVTFELNRQIVLARVRVPLPVVLRKPAVISAPGIMCPAPCPNEIVCRDAYVYEYHHVLSPGTMSPV